MEQRCPLCGVWNEQDGFIGRHCVRCEKIISDVDFELQR